MSTNICFTLQDLIFFSLNHLIRLLHPFSPSLLHAAKNNMLDCVLRDQLYRIAMTEKNAEQLKLTAELHPEYATWIDPDPLETQTGTTSLGGILLSNGCQANPRAMGYIAQSVLLYDGSA